MKFKQTILVVDDDIKQIRKPLVRQLRRLFDEYDILEAGNGKEAIALIAVHRPALVILDLMMPVMNGIDTLQEPAHQGLMKGSRIIIHTAASDDNVKLQALKMGALDFLEKTTPFDELNIRIRNFLDLQPLEELHQTPEPVVKWEHESQSDVQADLSLSATDPQNLTELKDMVESEGALASINDSPEDPTCDLGGPEEMSETIAFGEQQLHNNDEEINSEVNTETPIDKQSSEAQLSKLSHMPGEFALAMEKINRPKLPVPHNMHINKKYHKQSPSHFIKSLINLWLLKHVVTGAILILGVFGSAHFLFNKTDYDPNLQLLALTAFYNDNPFADVSTTRNWILKDILISKKIMMWSKTEVKFLVIVEIDNAIDLHGIKVQSKMNKMRTAELACPNMADSIINTLNTESRVWIRLKSKGEILVDSICPQ